jgi:hypothetical protein
MCEILLFARVDDAYMKTIPIIAKTKSGLVHFKLRMYLLRGLVLKTLMTSFTRVGNMYCLKVVDHI